MKYENLVNFLLVQDKEGKLPSTLLLPNDARTKLELLIEQGVDLYISLDRVGMILGTLDLIVQEKKPAQGWMLPHLAMCMIGNGGWIDIRAVGSSAQSVSVILNRHNQELRENGAEWELANKQGRCQFKFVD